MTVNSNFPWQVATVAGGLITGLVVALWPLFGVAMAGTAALTLLWMKNPVWAIAGIAVVGALMLRPTAAGQNITGIGLLLITSASGLALIGLPEDRDWKPVLGLAAATCIFWSYLLVHASWAGSGDLNIAMRSAVSHGIAVAAGAVLLSHFAVRRAFFQGLIGVMAGAAASWAVTVVLQLVVGLDALHLFQFRIEGYPGAGDTYFPATTLAGTMNVGALELPRLLGWFREPGIYQAFCIWGLFTVRDLGLDHWIWRALLVLGLLATFSTAGIALLPATVGFAFLLRRVGAVGTATKIVALPAFLAATWWALYYTPILGIADKFETHGRSITVRTTATRNALDAIANGEISGIYSATAEANAGINLVGQTALIGLLGLTLYLAVVVVGVWTTDNWKRAAAAFFPILATAVVAQPLLDAPLVYLLLMAPRTVSGGRVRSQFFASKDGGHRGSPAIEAFGASTE